MTVPNWRGIHSVLVTPFDAAGKIDFKRFEALVDANIANGADGVIVCGSTGEFYTMTIEERDALFKATVLPPPIARPSLRASPTFAPA
jgi:4-hydroxy-tetrahydrodipicolinate synthase